MINIKIIDYGCGNLASVISFFRHYDPHLELINSNVQDIPADCLLILPGVGSFRDGIQALISRKLDGIILSHVNNGGKILGICLGFQLLFSSGTEGGVSPGLNLIDGNCVSFKSVKSSIFSEPLPHVGFNSVCLEPLKLIVRGSVDFYFVHSYCVPVSSVNQKNCRIVPNTYGGIEYVAAVSSGNIYGFQFHPEKSQSNGFLLLDSILSI